MTFQEEYASLIEKHLPSQVGAALNKELDHLKKLEKDLENTTAELKSLRTSISADKEKISTLTEKLSNIDLREKKVSENEQILAKEKAALEILRTTYELTIKHCAEMVSTVKEMFRIPFSNRILRESILQDQPLRHDNIVQGPYNCQSSSYEQIKVPTEVLAPAKKETIVEEE